MENREILAKLDRYELTDFERRVLKATLSIKSGHVKTYKQIAEAIGHPRAYRAVGTALKNNPLPITIPCHRVVRSNGDTGNYSGRGGRTGKVALLKREGYL